MDRRVLLSIFMGDEQNIPRALKMIKKFIRLRNRSGSMGAFSRSIFRASGNPGWPVQGAIYSRDWRKPINFLRFENIWRYLYCKPQKPSVEKGFIHSGS
jgi:hypothetical protein